VRFSRRPADPDVVRVKALARAATHRKMTGCYVDPGR